MLQTAEKKKTEQRCLTAALVFNALFLVDRLAQKL